MTQNAPATTTQPTAAREIVSPQVHAPVVTTSATFVLPTELPLSAASQVCIRITIKKKICTAYIDLI